MCGLLTRTAEDPNNLRRPEPRRRSTARAQGKLYTGP